MEKDHLEILLEDMNKKFDLVLEGHAVLGKKIEDKADEANEKIELTNLQIKALNQKIDSVETRLNKKIEGFEARLNKKIEGVEEKLSTKLDAVASDLAEHRADTEKHKIEYKVSE